MDTVSKKKRSEIMSRVKGKNTSLEKLVFSYLRSERIYFQRHYKRAPGSPDVALPSKRKAVFLDGGFWHGWKFEERKDKWPKFWQEKIGENILRDRRNRIALKKKGWSVIRVWDHQLSKNPQKHLHAIAEFLKDS